MSLTANEKATSGITDAGTQPVMKAYKRAVAHPHFQPTVEFSPSSATALTENGLKWYHSERAEGVSARGTVPRAKGEAVLTFDEAPAVVLCNGAWRFVEDGRLDLAKLVKPGGKFAVAIFFTPRGGANTRRAGAWLDHYHHRLRALPAFTSE